ncbi:MAG: PAS domain S-box protein [Alphaproteobacteria bacterium]|nr:MAG: PAS domain S-box protein [Alphaproteobacteria bacterium]
MTFDKLYQEFFDTGMFMSRGASMNWNPDLLMADVVASIVNAVACGALALGILLFSLRRRDFPWHIHVASYLIFGLFLIRAAQNLMAVLLIWQPLYGVQTLFQMGSATLTMTAALVLWTMKDKFLHIPGPAHIKEVEGRLREMSARISNSTANVDQMIDDKTLELLTARQRFEQALRGAGISVFTQDKNLRYTWLFSPNPTLSMSGIGKTDFEVIPPSSCGPVVALKQRAIAGRKPVEGEISITEQGRETWYRMHIEPVLDEHGDVLSLNGITVDISDRKMLEDEQVRLSSELAANLQYYKLAMESSHTVVFTIDKDLRYATVSHEFLGKQPDFYIGKTNAEALSPENYAFIKPLKQKVMDTGEAVRGEFKAKVGNGTRWYDISLAPLKNRAGLVVGLTGAAIDISERKGWEQHLRLLMRELTHRSKNLLAVIQAMARQTARHTDSVDMFIERFGARLHALAGSHDLLVQESWQRASISELLSSQLGHYSDLIGTQIIVKGPQVYLNPDAAQNLGMALHEMATNAVKYGALSTPNGQVTIMWEWKGQGAKRVLRLIWREKGGPTVKEPKSRGFGSQVIERNLTRALGADVKLDYAPTGFKAEMDLPQKLTLDEHDIEEAEGQAEPDAMTLR